MSNANPAKYRPAPLARAPRASHVDRECGMISSYDARDINRACHDLGTIGAISAERLASRYGMTVAGAEWALWMAGAERTASGLYAWPRRAC